MKKKDGANGSKRFLFFFTIILLIGAIVRAVYFLQLRQSDLGSIVVLDSRFYYDLASRVSSGGGMPDGALTFNPLYPAFLIVLFRLFGDNLDVPRIVQSILGIATLFLLFFSGKRLVEPVRKGWPAGEMVGLISAALIVFYPQVILYEGSLVAVPLVMFFLTASFFLALVIDQDQMGVHKAEIFSRRIPAWFATFVLGAILGLGALGRPNLFFILIPAVSLWLFIRHRKRKGAVLAFVCLISAVLMLLPPVFYNAARTGDFVPVTAHGGINFYIGNGPEARPIYVAPEGMRTDMQGLVEDAKVMAEREVGRSLTNSEASDYYFRKTLDGILSNPAGWFRLLGMKMLIFWNGVEVFDIFDVSFYDDFCPVLKYLFVPFAVLSPLSLLGFVVLWIGGRNRSIVLLFVAATLASVLLFFVSTRYRLPVVPILILSGAIFISWLIQEFSRHRWKRPSLMLALFIAILFLVSTRRIVEINRSANYTFLGNYYMSVGEEEKSEKAFATAYELDSTSVETQVNYARAVLRRGDTDHAAKLYAIAFESSPDFPVLAVEYAYLLEGLGRREEAKKLYLYAYSLDRKRDRIIACKLLSRSAYRDGRRDEAAMWIRKALEIVPGDKDLIETLNMLEGVP